MQNSGYNCLIGNERKAVKYWNQSIEEAESLGSRVELARTHLEIGRRLYKKRNKLVGIQVDKCIEAARVLFKEMDLRWALEELDRIAIYQ